MKAETESTAIAMMEGVLVQASPVNQTATFTAQTSKAGRQAVACIDIMVCDNKGNMLDNAIIRFDGGATLAKFQLNTNSAKVYFSQEGKEYAIVCAGRDAMHCVSTEVPVNFKAKKNGAYTISVNPEEVEMAYLHLIDNLTGNDIDLLQTMSYSFEARTDDYASRFKLVFGIEEK